MELREFIFKFKKTKNLLIMKERKNCYGWGGSAILFIYRKNKNTQKIIQFTENGRQTGNFHEISLTITLKKKEEFSNICKSETL